jgi:hypothetical protein
MRLFNTETEKLESFHDSNVSAYAIYRILGATKKFFLKTSLGRKMNTNTRLDIRKWCMPSKEQEETSIAIYRLILGAVYRPTTDDNALRKGCHIPLKTTGVVTRLNYQTWLDVF